MAKNNSTSAQTIKEEYYLSSNDTWALSRVLTYCQYDKNVIFPYENILDKYNDYFDQFLEEVDVDPKYFKRPTAFAEYYYGDSSLYWLVLYYAKIPSILDFTKRKIKILPLDKLTDINQILINYKDTIESSYSNPTKI